MTAPHVFKIEGMSIGYHEIVKSVYTFGDEVAPRGQKTRELLDAVIHLEDPYDSLPTHAGRDLNLEIAAVEALQLVGGFSNPELNVKASRTFSQFLEPDGTFWGAYGNRIGNQVSKVVRKLQNDPDSRQAIITLWDPVRDNTPDKHDYPCTIMHAYRVRHGRLDASIVMRSNDVILGLAYDVFQFTQLQIAIAMALGTDVGTYTHHAVSLHIYERDYDRVAKLHEGTAFPRVSIGRKGLSFVEIRERAVDLGYGQTPDDMTMAEEWYLDTIRGLHVKT